LLHVVCGNFHKFVILVSYWLKIWWKVHLFYINSVFFYSICFQDSFFPAMYYISDCVI
jgi:hypothetical protein